MAERKIGVLRYGLSTCTRERPNQLPVAEVPNFKSGDVDDDEALRHIVQHPQLGSSS
jgi:hypothetical protein